MNKNTSQSLYYVLAYYHFTKIDNPQQLITDHKTFFDGRNATGRIYISEEGINGQMSAIEEDALAYMAWMKTLPQFNNQVFKIHYYHENVFPRMTVKYRKQLAALDSSVDMEKTGEHVPPQKWREMLESKNKYLLLDVRNEYEWQLGRFEGAECPPCETFREFKQYADELKDRVDPKKTPVMMYCTGGIRCELYSSLLKEKGFDEVYQLDGGVINYGLKEGSDHWLGKLFVFDDRLSVPISNEETPVIGTCVHCNTGSESYYNCANMDCNKLFICCPNCLQEYNGCCGNVCKSAPRLRPYHHQNPHKPFRKWYNYFDEDKKTKKI